MWDWASGRMADDSLHRIHSARQVHGDKGAFVGGGWVDIEDCHDNFNISHGSDKRHAAECKGACEKCPRSRSRIGAAKPDGTYDIIIIGAGCIGSAIARELSKTTASVLVLEAADDVTQGATKGNSGIIHAGFDDKPGSVRAKYCWPGNQMFPDLDRELHFGFQRNGSLVVATNADDIPLLYELMKRGEQNGVKNLRIVDDINELHQLEPAIDKSAVAALLSPDAGTVTPYEYTIALAENAVDNGVEIRTRREVLKIDREATSGMFTLAVKHWEPAEYTEQHADDPTGALAGLTDVQYTYSPSPGTVMGGKAGDETYRCRYVINAAGCASDKVAAMVGDTSWHVKPRMGEYILLNKNQGHVARHVLFPCPHPVYGKGVLVQSTLWGNLILGPTARDTMIKNQAGVYEPDPEVLNEPTDNIMGYLLSKCRKLVPGFDAGAVIHSFAGTRAKNTTGDWIIGPVAGVPGFINAASIDSPGIAASPAIAVAIVSMLKEAGAPVTEADPRFNPNRAPLITPKDGYRGLKMSRTDFWKVTDPKENVICKCERVTEQEVIDACRRSLPIDSTQAIRKRTRAGMGHCQGDPENYDCESRVAAIIARETGLAIEQVGRRPWPASSMMTKRVLDATDSDRLRMLSDPQAEYVLKGAA